MSPSVWLLNRTAATERLEPIIGHSLFKSITHLRNACATLAERCVVGISANPEMLRAQVENSIGLATALNPYLGYDNATEVGKGCFARQSSRL